MGLTSGVFIALLSLVAAAAMAATVALWRRVAGNKAWHRAARVSLLIVTQFTAIVAVLGGLNSYFSFVLSWSDLLGTAASTSASHARSLTAQGTAAAPISVTHTEIAGGKAAAGASESPRARQTALAASAARDGEILTIQLRGERTGITLPRSYVFLPPQYFQPGNARRIFPAVLVLSGYPSDPRSEITRLNLPAIATAAITAGRLQPTVFVMMVSSVAMPRDTECTDIPGGSQAETFFAEDVPLAVEQTFRVATGPAGWAVMGDSAGGYCAVKLAMMHSDRYAAAVSLSGYFTAPHDFTTGDLYGRSAAFRHENDLFWRLAHRPLPPVALLLATSRVGESDYRATLRFLRLIRLPMQGYGLVVPVGGHNFRTWQHELGPALEWLNHRLGPAAAAPGQH